ncbi:hypothetical protein V6N13_032936 [Hibiscus sabdariffa]
MISQEAMSCLLYFSPNQGVKPVVTWDASELPECLPKLEMASALQEVRYRPIHLCHCLFLPVKFFDRQPQIELQQCIQSMGSGRTIFKGRG